MADQKQAPQIRGVGAVFLFNRTNTSKRSRLSWKKIGRILVFPGPSQAHPFCVTLTDNCFVPGACWAWQHQREASISSALKGCLV